MIRLYDSIFLLHAFYMKKTVEQDFQIFISDILSIIDYNLNQLISYTADINAIIVNCRQRSIFKWFTTDTDCCRFNVFTDVGRFPLYVSFGKYLIILDICATLHWISFTYANGAF